MAKFNGNEWDIFVSETEPAANAANSALTQVRLSSMDFNQTRDYPDVTDKLSQSNTERIPGRKDASFSGEYFLDLSTTSASDLLTDANSGSNPNMVQMRKWLDDGTLLYFRVGRGNGRFIFTGYISEVGGSSGSDDAAVSSFSGVSTAGVVFDPDVSAA